MSVISTPEEWVRDITKRVGALENPTSARAGNWVLFEQAGSLMASAPGVASPINLSAVEQIVQQAGNFVSKGAFSDALDGIGGLLTDILKLLGNPAGVGTGFPILGDLLSQIPLLSGLFSIGGTLLAALIPGLDASKIISGSFPMSMVTGLLAALADTVQGLVDEFFGVVGNPVSMFTDFLKTLGGLFPALGSNNNGTASAMPLANFVISSGTAVLSAGVGGALQLIDGAAQTIEHALSGFLGIFGTHQGSLNAIASGFQGATTGSASVNDVQVAAQNAANTLASNSSAILALQQGTTVPPGGVLDITDFTSLPNAISLGGGFNQIYRSTSGAAHVLGIRDGRADWYPQSTAYPDQDRTCIAIKNDIETTGDDQMIGVSYSSVYDDGNTADYIIGRSDLTGDNHILAMFYKGAVFLYCSVGGTYTLFDYRTWKKNPSAACYLKCGPGRVFRVYENSTEILAHTEAGTTSAMGASYRHGGFGGVVDTAVFYWVPFFQRASKVTALSIADVA